MSQRQFHSNVYFNKQLIISILYIEVMELTWISNDSIMDKENVVYGLEILQWLRSQTSLPNDLNLSPTPMW